MAIGITTFIDKVLSAGTRPVSGGFCGRGFAKAGLALGREVDMAVRRVVQGRSALDTTRKPHQMAKEFFRVMKAAQLTITKVQVPARVVALNLRTTIDCMAEDSKGRAVVVELKTTQHTMATHAAAYQQPVPKRPKLSNGVANSLHCRHQLQAAFGMLATKAPRGVVVVVCADGGIMYSVDPKFAHADCFPGAVTQVERLDAPVVAWPDDDAPLAALRNYSTVVSRNPTVVEGPFGKAVVVIVHKHARYDGSRRAKNHRTLVKELARREQAAGVIVWLNNKKWHKATVAKRAL